MGELIPIKTAREVRLLGRGPHALERAAADGKLVRLRRGAYADPDNLAGISEEALHLARVDAARRSALTEPVFSHESAAALHGIPLIGEWPESVHVTVQRNGGKSTAPVLRSRRPMQADDIVVTANGALATSLVRTAVDLACARSLLGGIVAVSAVRRRGVTVDELGGVLRRFGAGPGVRRARSAIERSSEHSESVLEALVLARCQDYGFDPPEQQRIVRGVDDVDYRVDFAWDDGRVILEVDGKSKYAELAAADGRTGAEVLWAEKRREDALRPRCEVFLRADWSDAWGGLALRRRLEFAGVPRRERRAVVLTF